MDNPAQQFDVIVAGAGMTGATLALALARAGLKVAAVDAMPLESRVDPVFDGRASAVSYSAFRQWRTLGLGEVLEPVAQPMNAILVTDGPSPGAGAGAPVPVFLRFDAAEIADRNDGEPLGWMVENRHIKAALSAALVEAGVAVFAPVRVEAVETDPRGARFRLADGRMLAAPLAVGAEGRRSTVREAAGIGTFGWDYKQGGVVATVALERPHEGVAHEYFMPNGPLAILPLTENRASLVWTEKLDLARALATGSEEAFEAHLARRFGAFLGAPKLVGARGMFPLSLQIADRMIGERVALIGDAAHGIHPVAGQGLNLGLKDAAALAEVIVDARRLGEDWGSVAVLERYARWRRFDSITLAAAADVFVRVFSTDNPLVRTVRGAGLALVNRIAPARRFFAREAGGAVGEAPRLLRGEAL